MKFTNLNLLVPKDLKKNKVPMLVGEPGIGKSSWVMDLANDMGTKCFVLPVNQLADKADMTGCRTVPDPNNPGTYVQIFCLHVVLKKCIDYALTHKDETPILFLDEINRTTSDVTSEALSIPTLRSIGDIDLPPNVRVICAGNDKGNVISLDEASISRFVLYRVEPDIETFINANPGLNANVIAVLKKHPNTLFCKEAVVEGTDDEDNNASDDYSAYDFDGMNTFSQITTPRTITAVSDWLNEFSCDELTMLMNTPDGDNSNLLLNALIAHTGNTEFTMYLNEEIVNSTAQVQTPVNINLAKPNSFDICKTATSRDELSKILANYDEHEKIELLLYCLYDKSDNSNIIQTLVPTMTKLEPTAVQTLTQLSTANLIDSGNMEALYNSTGEIPGIVKLFGM